MKKPLQVALAKLIFLLSSTWLVSQDAFASDVSEGVEPSQKHVFYMHGAWIEEHGLSQPHPKHGRYQYDDIVNVLEAEGYQVVSEVRQNEVHPLEYATEVAEEVDHLLKSEVPPRNIAVIGHSKGGQMALIVASLIQEPDIHYVVMAGCGKSGTSFRRSYDKFLRQRAQYLRGRILSIYDSADREAGTCQEAFNPSPGLETLEEVLHTGQGHGLFYSPARIWVDKIREWIG
jgi:hypothetical protein